MQPLLLELSETPGLDLNFSFLDDLVMAGTQLAVSGGIASLKASAEKLGLQLNMSKCELVSAVPEGTGMNLDLFDKNIPRKLDDGFKLLGAPIGTDEYCQSLTHQRATKIQDCLDAIGDLPDPHIALALLHSCASFG